MLEAASVSGAVEGVLDSADVDEIGGFAIKVLGGERVEMSIAEEELERLEGGDWRFDADGAWASLAAVLFIP